MGSMTADEKQKVFNLVKTISDYNAGYSTDGFDSGITFEDDFIEVIETEKTAAPQKIQEKPAGAEDAAKTEKPAEPAPARISETATLESVNTKIHSCTKCLLSQKRTNTVPGEGVINPLVMVIGEGPGEEEDLSGRPFVGAAGQLLDKMLAAISLRRDLNCFIANIVKCRPPFNRTPMEDEAAACSGFLQAQIHILKPKMILAMGRCAVQNLLKTSQGINALRGRFFEYNGIPLLGTYHPSALLRDASLKAPAWADLKTFRSRLAEICPGYDEDFKALQREALR